MCLMYKERVAILNRHSPFTVFGWVLRSIGLEVCINLHKIAFVIEIEGVVFLREFMVLSFDSL